MMFLSSVIVQRSEVVSTSTWMLFLLNMSATRAFSLCSFLLTGYTDAADAGDQSSQELTGT